MTTATMKKKPWYMKWWAWTIAGVVVLSFIAYLIDPDASTKNLASPSTPSVSPTPVVETITVPNLAGMPADEADKALKAAGLRGSFEGGDESVVMKSNWDVVSTDPAAGAQSPAHTPVVVHVKRADERLAAEAAQRAAAPVDEDATLALCEQRAAAEFPYGVKLHSIAERYASEQREGGQWFMKMGATVTNEYNAKRHVNVECWASGTVGAPVLDQFLAY